MYAVQPKATEEQEAPKKKTFKEKIIWLPPPSFQS